MHLLFSLILTILICGCKNSGQQTATVEATAQTKTPSMRTIATDPEARTTKEGLDFTVMRWDISGDTLIVNVRYSGGCRDHGWDMYFNGAIMKSLPPQALLHLKHTVKDGPDPCRGMPTETLRFDLSTLKPVAMGKLVVKWAGDSERSAMYVP